MISQHESLVALSTPVAILGYGNQGRAQALNLRDSGIEVVIGARSGGQAFATAIADGFKPVTLEAAVQTSQVVMFLLPDTEIPKVYQSLLTLLPGKTVGFAHGFAFHFGFLERLARCKYFLVGPKGAGAILRARYESGTGLPGIYAVAENSRPETVELAKAYAAAIGCATRYLKQTTFQEETESDLFGEQVVLCGGIPLLMQEAFEVLVENGHDPEMAFLETCFEAKLIVELWMKHGPAGMTQKISPTAFYGGLTRGREILGSDSKARMQKIFTQIRNGEFAKEWMKEGTAGAPSLKAAYSWSKDSQLQSTYEKLKPSVID